MLSCFKYICVKTGVLNQDKFGNNEWAEIKLLSIEKTLFLCLILSSLKFWFGIFAINYVGLLVYIMWRDILAFYRI